MGQSGVGVVLGTLAAFTWMLLLLGVAVFAVHALFRLVLNLRSPYTANAIARTCAIVFGASEATPWHRRFRAWVADAWAEMSRRSAAAPPPEKRPADTLRDALTEVLRQSDGTQRRFVSRPGLSAADFRTALKRVAWIALAPEIRTDLGYVCDALGSLERLRAELRSAASVLPAAEILSILESLGPLLALRVRMCGKQGHPEERTTVGDVLDACERIRADGLPSFERWLLSDRDGLMTERDRTLWIEASPIRQVTVKLQARLVDVAQHMATVAATLQRRCDDAAQAFSDVRAACEERYHRSTRMASFAFAVLAAVFLHANVLRVYRTIGRNELLGGAPIMQEIEREEKALLAKGRAATEADIVGAADVPLDTDFPTSRTPVGIITPDVASEWRGLNDRVEELSGGFAGAGLSPITPDGAKLWWRGFINRASQDGQTWWQRRVDDSTDFLGEVVMAALLTVVAEFWRAVAQRLGLKGGGAV